MRRVRALYFAAVRELVGVAEESLELPADVVTIEEFTLHIARVHEALAERMAAVRIARNERFANQDERIEDGDVLALIPPVAGG